MMNHSLNYLYLILKPSIRIFIFSNIFLLFIFNNAFSKINTSDKSKIKPKSFGSALNDSTLQAAIQAVGTRNVKLLLSNGIWEITDHDLTFPPNITLEFEPGAKFLIAANRTITIKGNLHASLDQIFTGLGTVVFQPATRPSVRCQWWGAKGDGRNDDAGGIQKAINSIREGTILVSGSIKEWNLTKQLTLDSNKRLLCDGKFTSTIINYNELPVSFIYIEGNNIEIDGFQLSLNPENFRINPLGKGGGISLGASNNVNIKNTKLYFTYYGISCFGEHLINDLTIENCEITGIAFDIYLSKCNGSNITIKNNKFLVGRNWDKPRSSGGSICMSGGHLYENQGTKDQVTNSIYENKFFDNIIVDKNYFYHIDGFPINIKNAKSVIIKENLIQNKPGPRDLVETSNDCITLQLCRNFVIENNVIHVSGENGIDLCSSKNGIIRDNKLNKIATAGLYFDLATAYVLGRAQQLNKHYLLTEDITVKNNFVEAMFWIDILIVGRNINFQDNTFKYYSAKDDNPQDIRMNYTQIVIHPEYFHPNAFSSDKNVGGPAFYDNDSGLQINNIKITGSKIIDPTPVSFSIHAQTGICATTEPHNLASGYPVQIKSRKSPMQLPQNISTDSTYFVIRVSPTTFKIADSFQNAKKGKSLDFKNDGQDLFFVTSKKFTINFREISFPYASIKKGKYLNLDGISLDPTWQKDM